jgi:rod shape-determining protein MreC
VNVLRSRALAAILVLSVILAWLVLDQLGPTNPIRDTFSRVLSPVQFVLQRAVSPISKVANGVVHVVRLGSENEALRNENAELRNLVMLLQEARLENENLRRELEFKSAVPNYHLLSAEVIGHDPNNLLQYLIIDRGADDGLEPGMPVLTADGLVGRISRVNHSSATVMLISDPSSSVSALIQRSRATGLVQGYPGQELVMRYIPQGEEVEVGDVVLTSGLGGSFPKRLVIGQVASVKRADVEMFQEARVVPAVRLRDLEMVQVLLNFERDEEAQELAEP